METFQSISPLFEPLTQKNVSKVIDDEEKLYYLEQLTTGKPRDIIRGCLHIPPEVRMEAMPDDFVMHDVAHAAYGMSVSMGSTSMMSMLITSVSMMRVASATPRFSTSWSG